MYDARETNSIEYLKSKNLVEWSFFQRNGISVNFPGSFKHWHPDICYSERFRQYYMICTGFFHNPQQILTDIDPRFRRYSNIPAVSKDLKNWKVPDRILRPRG